MYPSFQCSYSGPSNTGAPPASSSARPSAYPNPGEAPPPPGPWTGGYTPQPQLLSQSSSSSSIQVRIIEQFRIDPPITVPTSLMPRPAAPQSGQMDLTLEMMLIEEAGKSDVQAFLDSKPGCSVGPDVQKYLDMGFSRDQVSLGLAYCQQAKIKESEVVDFANNYRELRSMGYNPLLAAGALLKSSNDLTVATETCLTISS